MGFFDEISANPFDRESAKPAREDRSANELFSQVANGVPRPTVTTPPVSVNARFEQVEPVPSAMLDKLTGVPAEAYTAPAEQPLPTPPWPAQNTASSLGSLLGTLPNRAPAKTFAPPAFRAPDPVQGPELPMVSLPAGRMPIIPPAAARAPKAPAPLLPSAPSRDYSSQISGQGAQPNAYSRITRTPLYIRPSQEIAGGTKGGTYDARTGRATVASELAQPGEYAVNHESAHDIYFRSGVWRKYGDELAGMVPQEAKDIIASNSAIYRNLDPWQLANEGLGYAMGNRWGTTYVKAVASRIQDPRLRQQLLRMHENGLAAHERASAPSSVQAATRNDITPVSALSDEEKQALREMFGGNRAK